MKNYLFQKIITLLHVYCCLYDFTSCLTIETLYIIKFDIFFPFYPSVIFIIASIFPTAIARWETFFKKAGIPNGPASK